MLDNFLQTLPEVIFDAAEKLGGRCTGRFYVRGAGSDFYDLTILERGQVFSFDADDSGLRLPTPISI